VGYITANTRYSAQGLNNKSKELYGQTILEFLREQGFGVRSTGKWPTDDEETIRSLEYYIESAEERKEWSENTIDSVESVMNKVYEAIRDEGLDIEMLDIGYYDSEKNRVENINTLSQSSNTWIVTWPTARWETTLDILRNITTS